MATCLGDADAMLEASAASGTRIAIGHQGRFRPVNVKARELIQAGAIPTYGQMGAQGPHRGLLPGVGVL